MLSSVPDFLFEFNEQLINRSLEVAFIQNHFPKEFSGVHLLEVPRFLEKFKHIKYRLTVIKSPILDAIRSSELKISVKLLCEFKWGLNFTSVFNIDAEILANPEYSSEYKRLDLNVKDINLQKIRFKEGLNIPDPLVARVNSAIDDILLQDTWQSNELIPFLPLISVIDLPEMPDKFDNQLSLNLQGFKVIDDHVLLIALNLDATKSSEIPLTDILGENELALSISESALNRVIAHWWRYTIHPKTENISGALEVKQLDSLVNHLSNLSLGLGSKVASLGFFESDVHINRAWIDYDGVIKLNEPSISLNQQNFNVLGNLEVLLNAVLKVDVKVESRLDTSSIIPDRLTPWKDDKKIGTTNRTFAVQKISSKKMNVDLSNLKARVTVGIEGDVSIEVTEFDVGLSIDWNIPKQLKKRFESSLEKSVLQNYPSLPISSSLLKQNIQGTTVMYELKVREIESSTGSLIIRSNIQYVNSA